MVSLVFIATSVDDSGFFPLTSASIRAAVYLLSMKHKLVIDMSLSLEGDEK
jgi:hypothetical protein